MDLQTRGLAVPESILCLVKYEDVAACMKATHYMDFSDLTSFVMDRWLALGNRMLLGYSIPQVTSFCELTGQDDYANMFALASLQGLKQLEITVRKYVDETARARESDDVSISYSGASTSNVIPDHDAIEDTSPVLLTYRWRNCITGINQLFTGGADEFRLALNKFSLFKRFRYVFKKNYNRKVVAVCFHKETLACNWKIHGCSAGSGLLFYIKKYSPEHTCGPDSISRTITRSHSDVVAEIVAEKMRTKPLYRPIDYKVDMEREYGLDISYDNAWAGIEKARSNLYGEYKYSYQQLWYYCEAIKTSNPGSHVVFEIDSDNRFKRVFLSFKACIDGFSYCRPVLFLDSTFLTGRFRAQMFAATAKDGNNNLFPLAYAVVDSENKENWIWFMNQLKCIIKPGHPIVFVSDRNEGLLYGVSSVFPESAHGYCTAHLKNNMKVYMSRFPVSAREAIFKLFDEVIYANTEEFFEKKMLQLRQVFATTKPPRMQLSLYGLIDGIRLRLMKDMTSKRDLSKKWKSPITPEIDSLISDRLHIGSTWLAVKASETEYEVMATSSVTVHLDRRTCSCRTWQITLLPCAHALCAILKSKLPVTNFISPYYLTSTFKDTYSFNIAPVPTLELPRATALTCTIFPPKARAQPGRRKTARIRSIGEFSKPKRKFKCSKCNKVGHNRTGCRKLVEFVCSRFAFV